MKDRSRFNFGVNDMEITLYFVGKDADEAQEGLPFDSQESAVSYQDDNPGTAIFSALALVDFTTLTEEVPAATYKIIRFHQDDDNEVIATGLTLEEAQTHCKDPSTHGEGWFDGYEEE